MGANMAPMTLSQKKSVERKEELKSETGKSMIFFKNSSSAQTIPEKKVNLSLELTSK
jgi:hypothetical protein